MEKIHFHVSIDAPVQTVWRTMLEPESYRDWASVFTEGSRYEGDWETGSVIRFVATDSDGVDSGVLGHIVENRPGEFVSIEYDGQIVKGVDDTTSDFARALIGCHENYSFREEDGVTTVSVEVDAVPELSEMFDELWPVALEKLTEIAEVADREEG